MVRFRLAGHDYAPLCAVGVGRDLKPLRGPEEDRLAVGAGDHTPLQPLEGRVDLREILYPARVRVQCGSFPFWRAFAPPVQASLY